MRGSDTHTPAQGRGASGLALSRREFTELGLCPVKQLSLSCYTDVYLRELPPGNTVPTGQTPTMGQEPQGNRSLARSRRAVWRKPELL